MVFPIYKVVWYAALFLVLCLAVWRGRTPERLAGMMFLLASVLTSVVAHTGRWLDPQWGIFGVDVALLLILLILALRFDRVWLLFASAFQLLSVVIHLAFLVDDTVAPLPYFRGLVIWSYLSLIALAVGSLRVPRQRVVGAPNPPPP